MRGVEIHDTDARGLLAFDLAHIAAALGSAFTARVWTAQHVECTGAAAEALHSHSESGELIVDPALGQLAVEITQVIDGEFFGRLPDEQAPSVIIRAVDSTLWEVFGPSELLAAVSRAFSDVRPARYDAG